MKRWLLSVFLCITIFFPWIVRGQIQFDEVGSFIGIDHVHLSDVSMGGGVAIFDFDNDGWQDLYLTGGSQPDKLLRNLNGVAFEDASVSSGIHTSTQANTVGVVTGDIDNDGFRDILVTTEFGETSLLLHNQGNGTFLHLPNAINDGVDWKTAATFGDVNNDGLLDLYISAYVFQSDLISDSLGQIIGFEHDCSANRLFLNNGDLTFSDVSTQYGVGDEGCALAVAFTNYDNDNDIDLMVANDFGAWVEPSVLFENQYPNSQFLDVSNQTGTDFQIYGMGIAIGDYDKDADLDYYQTNLGRNVLARNEGAFFEDVTTLANVENDSSQQLLHTGWGAFFFDADNDSWPDLFVSNGWIEAAEIIANVYHDSNVLYQNQGNGGFFDVSGSAGVGSTKRGRGAAFGDLDNDGRIDFVVNNVHQSQDSSQFEMYHNVSNAGNWVAFQLHGVHSNRDAFGSHVTVVNNGVRSVAEVGGGSSHSSQNSSIVHFGLGEEQDVDSVIVEFHRGTTRILTNLSINLVHQVYEDVTTSVSDVKLEMLSSRRVRVWTDDAGSGIVGLFDVSGRKLLNLDIPLSSRYNIVELPESLGSGMYILKAQTQRGTGTIKLFLD